MDKQKYDQNHVEYHFDVKLALLVLYFNATSFSKYKKRRNIFMKNFRHLNLQTGFESSFKKKDKSWPTQLPTSNFI